MTIEINWGSAALSEGFGAVQDIIEILDFAVLETSATVPGSSTQSVFVGFLSGVETFLAVEGTGLTYLDGRLYGGTITEMSVYREDGGTTLDIVTFDGSISANEVFNIAVAEISGSDIGAIEEFFGSQSYVYNGTSAADFFPENAVSEDGITLNLTGDDDIKLLQGDDVFSAGDGDDVVKGASGDDEIYGGAGDDRLFGSTDEDRLFGGLGNDLLSGQRDDDVLFGGDGDDLVRGGGGEDDLFGGDGFDYLKGGFQDDGVFGEAGSDVVNGNAGEDYLIGGEGDDLLRGGGGDDLLFGERGDDRLKGGSGVDIFIMDANNGDDTVIDWDGSQDILVFADIDEGEADDGFEVTFFDQVGIEFTTVQALIDTYASVTADGVLFDFGSNGSMLLEGLDTLDGLGDDQIKFSMAYFDDAA